jgi:hypothetical protein
VLGEGETEEQALPIFAEKYWGKHWFELGVNFIGVGGEGNYAPFLRIAETLGIPWFIFSDGEENARKKVTRALNICGITTDTSHPNIVTLKEGQNFEKHLWENGYEQEIREAIIHFELLGKEQPNEQDIEATRNRVLNYPQSEVYRIIGLPWESVEYPKLRNNPSAKVIDSLWSEGYDEVIKQKIIDLNLQKGIDNTLDKEQAYNLIKLYEDKRYKPNKQNKTKLAPLYAEIISNLPDERKFPPAIRELLERISATLRLKPKEEIYV